MKSKKKQLSERGYFSKEIENKFLNYNFEALIELLNSKLAVQRTVAASLISKLKNSNSIPFLCLALEVEKKLYTKIEISNALASYKLLAAPCLIKLLGKIGNNQCKSIPEKKFKKNNYPLPRDIAARTIIRIGKVTLPLLVEVLKSRETQQLREAIGAIGFICFYKQNDYILPNLITCYNNNSQNELIKWKLIRAMSAFLQSESFLINEKNIIGNLRIKIEIDRSLFLINKNKNT